MTLRRSLFRRHLGFAALAAFALGAQAQRAPEVVFDPTWPKDLPNNWKLGGITGLALDRDENVWLYNRPNDLTNIELHAELDPPLALCCVRAPSMIHLDRTGRVMAAINASAHATRASVRTLRQKFVPVLVDAAARISRNQGAPAPGG